MKLAEYQDLYYVKKVDFGVYLAEDMGGETHVLLPSKQVKYRNRVLTGRRSIERSNKMGKIAFIFSGQGAQYSGMGKDLYDNSPAAKAVYEMADSIRENTSKQCFEGTMEELSKTVNTQPCIFTADLAAARALVEKGITPDCVAGFSLGEISALAFSGILSDEEAFRLVCKRGELMDKAATENPGAMAAVLKLTPEKVEEICSRFDKTYPVNYNSPAQTVVATTSENADAFCEAVKAEGGRAKLLAVSGAFHSPFMADAAEGLGKYMENVDFAQPKVQIYSDYTAQPYSGLILLAKQSNIFQLCSPAASAIKGEWNAPLTARSFALPPSALTASQKASAFSLVVATTV